MLKSLFLFMVFAILGSAAFAEAAYTIPATRTATWQGNVGVTYREGIPARTTICATADAATYGTDSADATSYLQGLIDSCSNGQTVYIPAGTYRLNSGLTISKTKQITIRGAGPSSTMIKSYQSGGIVLNVGTTPTSFGLFASPNFCPQTNAPAGYVQDVTSGTTDGSSSVTVADASSFAVGDSGLINFLNNNDSSQDFWTQATNIGQEGDTSIYGFCCATASTCRSFGQLVEITAIDGNTITITPPLYTDISGQSGVQIARIAESDHVQNVGIEDLKIFNANGTSGAGSIIKFNTARSCWVKNIETDQANGRHILFEYANLFNEVRDSYLHNNLSFTSNNYGILIEDWGSANLIENNITKATMVPFMLGSGASGNVVGYNYVNSVTYGNGTWAPWNWGMASLSQHAAGSWMNLAEGNQMTDVLLDNIHGTESHFTAFRNELRLNGPPWDEHGQDVQSISNEIMRGSRLHNFIGNILGYPDWPYVFEFNGTACTDSGLSIFKWGYDGSGCETANHDTKSKSTTLLHGNYDYATNAINWNGTDDTSLPNSLYLPSKPAWWGDGPWPAIGPDLTPMVSSIPARERYFSSLPAKRYRGLLRVVVD